MPKSNIRNFASGRSATASRRSSERPASLRADHVRRRDVPPTTNAFWQNESFHNYADYAMSDEFRAGLHSLRELKHDDFRLVHNQNS